MPDEADIQIKHFDDLTLAELHACYKLRGEVFVVGQQICAVPDVDEDDPRCHHVMLWVDGELRGTARLLVVDGGAAVKVGRVAVAVGHQRGGLGTVMMRRVQDWISAQPGRRGVMSAQAHLVGWYTRLGWHARGGGYLEAGIDHQAMEFPA